MCRFALPFPPQTSRSISIVSSWMNLSVRAPALYFCLILGSLTLSASAPKDWPVEARSGSDLPVCSVLRCPSALHFRAFRAVRIQCGEPALSSDIRYPVLLPGDTHWSQGSGLDGDVYGSIAANAGGCRWTNEKFEPLRMCRIHGFGNVPLLD